jgi:predicted ATP-dependent serine protease
MRSIAFLSQKGGSGKTTLAVHIAVAAAQSENVILIDTERSMANDITCGGRWIRTGMCSIFWCSAAATKQPPRSSFGNR